MRDKNQELEEQNQQEKNEAGLQSSGEVDAGDDNSDPEKSELLTKIEQLEKERDELKDKFLRKAAEFENYKKRTEQEFATFHKFANEQLIIDLLPVIDDFERSLHVSKDRREFGPFYKGIELIYKKFLNLLEAKGVKPIVSEGKPFDVDLHNALMQIPKDNVDPNTVIEEVEKGYIYNDKVIRHAKVIVAKENESDESDYDEATRDETNNRESN